MSDVLVSAIESVTTVASTDNVTEVTITESPVTVSSSTAGLQGASYNQGDPIYVIVRNATGATLNVGDIVYTSGGNGTHTQVTKALAASDATSARVLGWMAQTIAHNASGLCQVEGYLDGIDTQGIAEGTQLYLSGTTAGAFQSTKPQAPIHLVYVGVCVKSSSGNGRVYVKVQNGYEISEIHDVSITSVANDQVLRYNSSNQLWENVAVSTLTTDKAPIDSPTFTTQITTPVLSGPLLFTNSSGVLDKVSAAPGLGYLPYTASVPTGIAWQNLATLVKTDAANTFTVGGHVIANSVAGTIPLTITGASAQTADLLLLRNFANTTQFRVDPNGMTIANSLGVAGSPSGISYAYFTTPSASAKPIVVRGAASQSANLQEWQNSAGTVRARINSDGILFASTIGGINQLVFLREENSGGLLEVKKQTATASNPGANNVKLYVRDGTTTGTLKLVVRAGAAGAETTILDNIPQ